MKCSEARRLSLIQELRPEQIEALRQHGRQCNRCAQELEGALLARCLRDEPEETPPAFFTSRVMAQIETAPAPGALTREQKLATVSFFACLTAMALGWTFAKSRLATLYSGGWAGDVSIQPLKDFFGTCFQYADLAFKVMLEASQGVPGHLGASVGLALVVLVLLTITLFGPKLKPVKAILF